tara:strand:+ start:358 stop:1017 length:660 start_codon:yes stop_codon:yes gene_type:complete
MNHSEQFFNFLTKLDSENIRYVIIRGFKKFPESGDSDVDLVFHLDDEEKYKMLAMEYLDKGHWCSRGSGEWCEMMYYPSFTKGPKDQNIDNGLFRVDSYNSLHFKSPYNNFKTWWTCSKEFNNLVIETRKEISAPFGKYYIPDEECEITLLVVRNVLDNKDKNKFSSKHSDRILEILDNADREKLVDRMRMALPFPEKVVDLIYQKKFTSLFKAAMGYA